MKIKLTKRQVNLLLKNIPPGSSIQMSGKDFNQIVDKPSTKKMKN